MIEVIRKREVELSLNNNHRQYFVGRLTFPQELRHVDDENVEIGITRYSDYSCESPHIHPEITDYQIVLKGKTKYVDLNDDVEYVLSEGDLLVIRPGTKHIQKSQKGTELLFIKCPAKNDKVLIEATDKMNKWAMNWEERW